MGRSAMNADDAFPNIPWENCGTSLYRGRHSTYQSNPRAEPQMPRNREILAISDLPFVTLNCKNVGNTQVIDLCFGCRGRMSNVENPNV